MRGERDERPAGREEHWGRPKGWKTKGVGNLYGLGTSVKIVAVGTALTGGPPHRSVQEELPHTALSSGRTCPRLNAAGRGPPAESTRRIRLCVRGVVNGKDRPLARSPSLHGLRRRLRADFVRPLRWYYEIVRLPRSVHAGRAAIAFSSRPSRLSTRAFLGSPGSRAWSVHACSGSVTPRRGRLARA